MSSVKQLHEMTKKMYDKLKDSSFSREQMMEDITTFLNGREAIIKDIKAPYTEEEQKLGREVVEMDKEIQKVIQSIFMSLKGSMKQLQNQKKNNTKYVNPYSNVSSMDGMFYDKRK